jgi:hypothetical protein
MLWRASLALRKKATAAWEARETRHGERQLMQLHVTARLPAGDPVTIIIENLSISGFRAIIPLELKKGTLLRVSLPGGRSPHARVVRTEKGRVGCVFLAPLQTSEVRMLTVPEEAF